MNPYALPPVVAALVGVVLAVTRRLSAILVSSSVTPSIQDISLSVLGGRFVAFVLVYGLLFGVAYWAGTRRDDASADGKLALATGTVAALAYLLGTVAVFWLIEAEQDLLVGVLATGGSGVAVGVQLGVVAFAGVALARRQ